VRIQDEKGEVPGFGNQNKNIINKSITETQINKCAC
jgi:hypothetical protein